MNFIHDSCKYGIIFSITGLNRFESISADEFFFTEFVKICNDLRASSATFTGKPILKRAVGLR